MRRYAAPVALLLLAVVAAALLLPSAPPIPPPPENRGAEIADRPAEEPGSTPVRRSDPVRVPAGRKEEPRRPAPDSAARFFVEVRGSVCDSTGRPIEGARVAAALDSESATLVETRTGGDGSFRLSLSPGGGPRGPTPDIALLAEASGFSPTVVQGMRPSWNRTVEAGMVALLRPGTLEGRVLLPDGRPAPAAEVRANPPGAWATLAPLLGWGVAPARPDSSGAFRLEGIPPGNLRVVASSDGFSPVSREGLHVGEGKTVGDVELRFRTGSFVAGTALDASGRPVPGATVRYEAGGGEPLLGKTVDSGRFRLGPRPSGETGTLTAWTETLASP